jgi:ABC-2 type transport system permease protein
MRALDRVQALRAFVIKELWHILRDRQTLIILLLMPLAQVVLFGFAIRTDVTDIRLVVVDGAMDEQSLGLRARFTGNGRFRVIATLSSPERLEPWFRRGQADVALVIPAGLANDMAASAPVRLQLITDASNPNTGTTMQTYASAVIASWQNDWPGMRAGVVIVPEVRMRFNPTLESVNLFVPGLIALVLTLVTALMTAISLSREMERGTLEILLVSPLRPWQIILGKVAPYLLLAFANVLTALGAAWAVFQVPFRGSLTLLLAASTLYSLVGLALGVVIAARTSSQRAAMIGAMLGTMLPSVLLSGMIFPIASLPDPLQVVSNVVPARWFIVVVRGIMLKGAGVTHLWQELLVLTAMFVLLLVVATRSFRARLA